MRTENVIDSLIWFVNVLLAFAIILFAFLFILFPKRDDLQRKYQDDLVLEDNEAPPSDARVTIEQFRPCWKGLSSPAVAAGPKSPKILLRKLYKITSCKQNPEDFSKWQVYLFHKTAQDEKILNVGDALDGGYRIVEIGKDYLIAERAGSDGEVDRQRLEYYHGDEEPEPEPGNPDQKAGAIGGGEGEFLAERDKDNPNHWKVSSAERDYVLANQDKLINDVSVRPYVPEGGGMQGLVVDDFPATSLLAKRGFAKGDVVRSVNGVQLTSSEAANSLLSNEQVRSAGSVQVVIERQGRTVTLQFDVR